MSNTFLNPSKILIINLLPTKYDITTMSVSQSVSQSISLSLKRNPSLHAFDFLSFAMCLQVGPIYQINSSYYLVLGRPRGFLCSRDNHSVTDYSSVVSSSPHVSHPSVFAFSYVPNTCRTTLFLDSVRTFSVLESDSYHDSLHLLGYGQVLKLSAKRPGFTAIYVITGSIHSLNANLECSRKPIEFQHIDVQITQPQNLKIYLKQAILLKQFKLIRLHKSVLFC